MVDGIPDTVKVGMEGVYFEQEVPLSSLKAFLSGNFWVCQQARTACSRLGIRSVLSHFSRGGNESELTRVLS